MKIDTFAIAMTSQRKSSEVYTKNESLRVWVDEKNKSNSNTEPANILKNLIHLSQKAMCCSKDTSAQEVESPEEVALFDIPEKEKQKIRLIEKILEALTGKHIKIRIPERTAAKKENVDLPSSNEQTFSAQVGQPERQGWGLVCENHESYQETEKISFTAAGIIKTADGENINFETQLNMSRQFITENHISIRAGDGLFVDPLVINYSGMAAELTESKFSFDLDSNGTEDQISFVSSGNGFLAADTNRDGIINNGTELFGPQTGNGFNELAQFDDDNNKWIDESDSIFNKLRIWTKDENGNDNLFALGQVGIGAIYLGNIETDFTIKNQVNESLGQIQKTGIFIKENGIAGTIQQIDLIV
ncbi:MAG: hypothetical protein EHM85_00635 [Desulfobacteraceae bacterium]|nr:MAG: hypothetical protein EHM85_00635 [Desulfobacteraceae bacterium]